jgi:hypothetical protein
MNTDKFYRKTLFNQELVFGLDSVQGYLEFSNSSQRNKSQLVFSPEDEGRFDSAFYKLKQLEHENYIEAKWELRENENGEKYFHIVQMCLTTSGHELLDKLTNNSKVAKLKHRVVNLLWVIVTSIATTLIVLYIKSE